MAFTCRRSRAIPPSQEGSILKILAEEAAVSTATQAICAQFGEAMRNAVVDASRNAIACNSNVGVLFGGWLSCGTDANRVETNTKAPLVGAQHVQPRTVVPAIRRHDGQYKH